MLIATLKKVANAALQRRVTADRAGARVEKVIMVVVNRCERPVYAAGSH